MNRLTDYFEKVILSKPMKDDNIFLNDDEYIELVEYARGSDFYKDIIDRKNAHKKIIFHGDGMFSIFFYHSETDELFFIVYSHANNEFRWKSWEDANNVNIDNMNCIKSNLVDCNSCSLDDNPVVKKYYEMHQTSDIRDVNIEREAFIVRDIYMFGDNIQNLKNQLQHQIVKLQFYFPYTKDEILEKLQKYKDQVMLEEYYNCLSSENMAILGF
jgi:hypothetical protein